VGESPLFYWVQAKSVAKAAGGSKVVPKIEEIAGRIAGLLGIEVVEIELKGGGKNQFLRVSIDKPQGVTHLDCETVSRQLGEALDAEDLIPAHYTLEVSSPGVERKLFQMKDFERFQGKKAKVVLREPIESVKTLEGRISSVEDGRIALELAGGNLVRFPFSQVERANLKFEW
jgi:ribosome maturation factor RimP